MVLRKLEELDDKWLLLIFGVPFFFCCVLPYHKFCGEPEEENASEVAEADEVAATEEEEADELAATEEEEEAQEGESEDEEQRPEPDSIEWGEKNWIDFADGEDCPEGYWALLPHGAPGSDEFERRENEERRDELAEEVEAQTFVVSMPTSGLSMRSYDFERGAFPVSVSGDLSCETNVPGERGSSSVVLTSASVDSREVPHRVTGEPVEMSRRWDVEDLELELVVGEEEGQEIREQYQDAQGFLSDPGDDFDIRIAFEITGVDHDERKVRDENYGQPVGAGPIIQAKPIEEFLAYKDTVYVDSLNNDK